MPALSGGGRAPVRARCLVFCSFTTSFAARGGKRCNVAEETRKVITAENNDGCLAVQVRLSTHIVVFYSRQLYSCAVALVAVSLH